MSRIGAEQACLCQDRRRLAFSVPGTLIPINATAWFPLWTIFQKNLKNPKNCFEDFEEQMLNTNFLDFRSGFEKYIDLCYSIVTVEYVGSYKLINTKNLKVMNQTQPVLSIQPHVER